MKSENEKQYIGNNHRVVASPIRLKGSIIGSPSRYIPTYNPGRDLTTADKGLAKALEETYKMKDNMTEESVLKDLDSMLATFDEQSSTDSDHSGRIAGVRRNERHLRTEHIPSKKKSVEKSPVDEFYFQKSSWTKRYSVPISVNPKDLENKDFRNRIQTDANKYKKSPKSNIEIKVYSSPINASKGKTSKFYVENNSRSSTLEKQTYVRNTNRQKDNTLTKKPLSPDTSSEYKIELFKTTEKKNSIVRTDTASTRSKPSSPHKPLTPKSSKEFRVKNANNDAPRVYSTVKGFDSFMMY